MTYNLIKKKIYELVENLAMRANLIGQEKGQIPTSTAHIQHTVSHFRSTRN